MKNLWKPTELKRLRECKGWTQEELARSLGVTFATVNRWENGHSAPRRSHQQALDRLARIVWLATVPRFLPPRYDIKKRVLTIRYRDDSDAEQTIEIKNPSQSELDEVMGIAHADPWDELDAEKDIPVCLEPYFAAKHDIPAVFGFRDAQRSFRKKTRE